MRVKRSFKEVEVVDDIMTRSLAILLPCVLSSKNQRLKILFTEIVAGKLDSLMYVTESHVGNKMNVELS